MSKKHQSLLMVLVLTTLLALLTFPATAAVEKIKVEATGSAPIQADRGLTKESALKDAFRAALEKALGVRITATTVMEDLMITRDVVVSQTWGHILSYSIVKEWEAQGSYFVTVTADVSSDTRWWADSEGILDVVRLHVKDLVLKKTLDAPETIMPGAVFTNQTLVIPVKGEKYTAIGIHVEGHQVLWRRELPGKPVTPFVTDGNWVVVVTTDKVLAINPQYGWVRWTASLDEPVLQTPVIDGEMLYLTTQKGRLLALDMKKGNLRWQYSSQSRFPSAPVVASDRLFFVDGSGSLHAMDLHRQSRIFKQTISPKLKAAPTPSPVATFISWADDYDRIYALNSADGSKVWEFTGEVANSQATAFSPYLAQGRILAIFTQGKESRLYLFDAKSGRLYWKQTVNQTVSEIIAVGNGLIILNTWGGIRVLDLEHGSQLWETGSASLKAQLLSGGDQLFYLHDKLIDVYE